MKTVNGLIKPPEGLQVGIEETSDGYFRVKVPRRSDEIDGMRLEKLEIMRWFREHGIRPYPLHGLGREMQFLPTLSGSGDHRKTRRWQATLRSFSDATFFYMRWG